MRVINVHERELNASLEKAGVLIDRLASRDDLLWPYDRWPAMRFDRPLGVGAVGGHGPIRYVIEAYVDGTLRRRNWSPWVRFLRWTKGRGRSAGTKLRVG